VKISIVSVGKTRSQPLRALEDEYRRRLRGRFATNRITVRSDKELVAKLADHAGTVVALDERGQAMTSEQFAGWLDRVLQRTVQVSFVVGDADGLPATVRDQAQATLSLSSLTLPHEFVPAILLEQLYRAQSILAGHPYHRR
jgi:23S rRNA (pseudouridine1915-N3)-methyltransferase